MALTSSRALPGPLLWLAVAACTGAQQQPPRPPQALPPEQLRAEAAQGEEWFALRAQALGLSVGEAKARDRAITRDGPPRGFWDEQVALQSASLWRLVCNECHPGRRGISSALAIPPPPAGWGAQEGVFFGRARRYGEIYDAIERGVARPPGTPSMPAFEKRLAREQIWGLIRFLEHASQPAK